MIHVCFFFNFQNTNKRCEELIPGRAADKGLTSKSVHYLPAVPWQLSGALRNMHVMEEAAFLSYISPVGLFDTE